MTPALCRAAAGATHVCIPKRAACSSKPAALLRSRARPAANRVLNVIVSALSVTRDKRLHVIC